MKLKKNIICIITVFLEILLFVIISYPQYVYATVAEVGMEGVTNVTGIGRIGVAINAIIGMIQVAGAGAAVISITLQGFRYITASPGEKANIKKQGEPLIIGSILVFATTTVVKIIAGLAAQLPSS